jgi:hypothetical protein
MAVIDNLIDELIGLRADTDANEMWTMVDQWIQWEKSHIPNCETCRAGTFCEDGKICEKELRAAFAALEVESQKRTGMRSSD